MSFWMPPSPGWVICNADGVSSSFSFSCGCLFRNHESNFLACFAENIDRGNVFHVEFSAVIRAIEIVYFRSWKNLWIESEYDSSLIPWPSRNRWLNHSHIIRRFIGEPRIGSCEPVRSSSAYWVAGIRTKIRSHKRIRSIGRKSGKIDGRDSFWKWW